MGEKDIDVIAKDVNYDLATEEWKALLDGGRLSGAQEQMARFNLAGLHAERDMAYHLRAFFAGRNDFRIFNNLKVEHDGLTAQIDHLVLTRWTAYFIESKSVSQVLTVNEHGEWGRIHNRRFMPIESPVEQSRRHKEVLYAFMRAHREQFMGKLLGLKTREFYRLLTPVHYVAVSTKGQIRGRGRSQFPEAMKADQIPTAILEYHDSLRRNILTGWNTAADMPAFNEKEFEAAIQFLLSHDVALTPTQYVHEVIRHLDQHAKPAVADERDASNEDLEEAEETIPASAEGRCQKCGSANMRVVHGPYGYFFKCLQCQANTPISVACDRCSAKMKVAKKGDEFALVCAACEVRRPFWNNPPEETGHAPITEAPEATQANAEPPRCPRCGSEMKLRTAQKGQNVGQQFWGCAAFPKCRGIVQV